MARSPAVFSRSKIVRFRFSLSEAKAPMSGSAGSGWGTRSRRWNVPCEARARSAVIAATMLPAAPVMAKTVSGPSSMPAGVGPKGTSRSATVQRRPSLWPTSTTPGSHRVSSTSSPATASGLAPSATSTAFTRRVGVLALEGLGEAGHCAAHRRPGTAGVVAVPAAELRGRQEERAGATDGLAEVVHGGVEELHPSPEQLAPAGEVELTDRRLDVQGRQPVDAADRAGGGEGVEACGRAPPRRARPPPRAR